jgi:hypothetical protein
MLLWAATRLSTAIGNNDSGRERLPRLLTIWFGYA